MSCLWGNLLVGEWRAGVLIGMGEEFTNAMVNAMIIDDIMDL